MSVHLLHVFFEIKLPFLSCIFVLTRMILQIVILFFDGLDLCLQNKRLAIYSHVLLVQCLCVSVVVALHFGILSLKQLDMLVRSLIVVVEGANA